VTPCRRLVGAGGGVLFRGSGFHQTDYRSESYKRGAKKDAEASRGGEAGK
jgi:predicted nucleic acid-binding Zn ribbon protein